MIANYDDAIRITDANMKDVVQFLEKKGVLENTLIVFASDHGEAFYEHKIYSHMYSLHAEIVNVPLFFHWPKKIKPSQSPLPASLVDIFPSLITLADLDRYRSKARDLEGMSLFQNTGQIADPSLFANRVRFGTTRISAQSTPKQRGQRRRRKGGGPKIEAIHRMVVKGNHKLIEEIENKKSTVYLYQLDDPKEVRVPQPAEFSPLVLSLMQEFRPLPQEYQDINEPQVDPDLDEHEPPPRLQKRDFLGKQKKKSKNQNITQRRRKRR
jgi:arylsulfatase A-like enzyme